MATVGFIGFSWPQAPANKKPSSPPRTEASVAGRGYLGSLPKDWLHAAGGVHRLGSLGGSRRGFAVDRLVHFLAVHGHLFGGHNAEPHLITANFDHGDG